VPQPPLDATTPPGHFLQKAGNLIIDILTHPGCQPSPYFLDYWHGQAARLCTSALATA